MNRKTKSAKAFDDIRHDILCGAMPAGEKLQMQQLSERYGVGFSPLREALSRLASLGLVTTEEQCGFYVPPLSIDELHDLYRARIHIQALMIEIAVMHADVDWEAEVVACWHRYSKFLTPTDNQAVDPTKWDSQYIEFTRTVLNGCQSPWLIKLNDMLCDNADRYRSICMSGTHINADSIRDYMSRTEQFVKALLKRDKDEAIQLNKVNLEVSISYIRNALAAKEHDQSQEA